MVDIKTNKTSDKKPASWPEPIGSSKGKNSPMKNKLNLDKKNGKLMGVCSGLAKWSGIDVNILRIAFVLAALFGVGAPVIIYLAIGLIVD
jgi:phage shock protein C